MTRVLLIGSGNADKAAELRGLLRDTPWNVQSLSDYGAVPEPEETEETFQGNALLKARYYSEQFGVACVADDSGIEVDHLEGAPGVYSARYAGETCSYDDNNQKLLAALEGVTDKNRGAQFVCCAAFVDGSGGEHIEHGIIKGTLASKCLGQNGFGYDPLFVPEGFDRTFSQLDPEEKSRISHRGRAFQQLCTHLAAIA